MARIMFEYPHLARDLVSEFPPTLDAMRRPDDGPTRGPGPAIDLRSAASDTGADAAKEDDQIVQQRVWTVADGLRDAPWYPHALDFLARIPRSDADWSRHLSCNKDVRALRRRLKIPYLYPIVQVHLWWSNFFHECAWHLAQECTNPASASLFSLLFAAACHVALADGCPRDIVLQGLRACVENRGIFRGELTEPMLDRIREGVINQIAILRDYSRVLGCRANEIPLHGKPREEHLDLRQFDPDNLSSTKLSAAVSALRPQLLVVFEKQHPVGLSPDNPPPFRDP
ncbi:hypothetical protein F66182_9907 [Fusarium sp. NRRL 66182]|nr:hypothetical protein F66182_9907 [Fusarium sp. NRRL 66182]